MNTITCTPEFIDMDHLSDFDSDEVVNDELDFHEVKEELVLDYPLHQDFFLSQGLFVYLLPIHLSNILSGMSQTSSPLFCFVNYTLQSLRHFPRLYMIK